MRPSRFRLKATLLKTQNALVGLAEDRGPGSEPSSATTMVTSLGGSAHLSWGAAPPMAGKTSSSPRFTPT